MKEKHQVPFRIMSIFSSHSEASAPVGAALGGFFKSLTLENPRYLAKVVDIQGGLESNGDLSLSDKADLIWDEIYDKEWTTKEIRYRSHMGAEKQEHAHNLNELEPPRLMA